MTTTPVPVILGPCAPLSNLRFVTAAGGTTPREDDDTDGRFYSRGEDHTTTFPPHTRCYSPSLSGRIAMRLLSLACLKGQARLMVIRP